MAEKDALDHVFRAVRRAVSENGCTRAILVGHNAHFDLGFVNAAVARTHYKRCPFHPFSVFDTATLAGAALGQPVLGQRRPASSPGTGAEQSRDRSEEEKREKVREVYGGGRNVKKKIHN